MNEFIGKPILKKLKTSTHHTSLNFLLENKNDPFVWSQLVAAAKQIPDISPKHLLTLLLPEKLIGEIDFNTIIPSETDNVTKLVA